MVAVMAGFDDLTFYGDRWGPLGGGLRRSATHRNSHDKSAPLGARRIGQTPSPATLVAADGHLGQVEENFNHARPEDDPDWVYWLNREEIDVMAGRCFTELKQPDRAESLLRGATASYDNALVRENPLYPSWLAEDYILLNEIDLAAEIATQVLNSVAG